MLLIEASPGRKIEPCQIAFLQNGDEPRPWRILRGLVQPLYPNQVRPNSLTLFLSAFRQNPLDSFCRRMVQRSYLFEASAAESIVFHKSGRRSPGPCKTQMALATASRDTSSRRTVALRMTPSSLLVASYCKPRPERAWPWPPPRSSLGPTITGTLLPTASLTSIAGCTSATWSFSHTSHLGNVAAAKCK